MPTEDRLVNITEAANILGVSKDYLYRNRRWEKLPFTVYLSERKIMFSLKGILKWIEEHQGVKNGRKDVFEEKNVLDRAEL